MPKLPTQLKLLKGTLRPCRMNPNEPLPDGELGEPPDYLERDEKKVWRELQHYVVPGQLTIQDRHTAEVHCILMAKMRRRETMLSSDRAAMNFTLNALGLTPVARSRVSVPKQKADDDIAQFLS
jgi:phage terminase small subunit